MYICIAMNIICINFAPQFRTTAIDIGLYNLLFALKLPARLIRLTIRGKNM